MNQLQLPRDITFPGTRQTMNQIVVTYINNSWLSWILLFLKCNIWYIWLPMPINERVLLHTIEPI